MIKDELSVVDSILTSNLQSMATDRIQKVVDGLGKRKFTFRDVELDDIYIGADGMDKMNKQKVAELTDKYYSEYELHNYVDKFLRKYKWIPQKDRDDFYSVANYYFIEAANDFDGTGNFNGYLKMVLAKKLSSYARGLQRQKRCDVRTVIINGEKKKKYYSTLSLDAPLDSEDGDVTLGDITPSNFNLEDNTSEDMGLLFSPDIIEYLNNLPERTKKIALMISDGYKASDICEKMRIEEKEYQVHLEIIHTYEYRKPMEWRYM